MHDALMTLNGRLKDDHDHLNASPDFQPQNDAMQ